MKFTLNWLKEYVEIDLPASEISDRLTMLGLEVDSVTPLAAGLDKVVVGRVEEVSPHPNADRLTCCRVFTGEEEVPVVCGAPNVRAGMLVAVALPGARLPSGMEIRVSKIRGVASRGMLCSERELGVSDEHQGIMELPDEAVPGTPLVQALGLDDMVIEVDLTPNRPDCASVIGIARELAGVVGKKVRRPVESAPSDLPGNGLPFSVEILSPDCLRYAARLIRNVKVAPSPWWLRRTLIAAGLRPINNVVDITNFVMLEYGQPLHAFDFARLHGAKIVVRNANPSESIITLDGVERTLTPEMMLICDADQPVAVAGIMGGANSEVEQETTDVLLESACFDPVSVRRTAAALNLSTDASYRFERGVDPELAPIALERAVRLMAEICSGEPVEGVIDVKSGLPDQLVLSLRPGRVNDLLGLALSADEIVRLLEAIEFSCSVGSDGAITVRVPTFRVDIEREVDLVEEVARLIGYNNIPTTMPQVAMALPRESAERRCREELARLMHGLGFSEAINYSFIDPKCFDALGVGEDDPLRSTVRILNPLAEDQSVMRTLLLPGLLANARHNINRQQPDLRLFEIGKVFFAREEGGLPEERYRLGAILCGRRALGTSLLHGGEDKVDFFDAKGVAEEIGRLFRLDDFCLEPGNLPSYLDPQAGLVIMVDGRPAGHVARVADHVCKGFGIREELFYLEWDISSLVEGAKRSIQFTPLPKFPAVNWDLAVVVDDAVGAGQLVSAIREAGFDLVEAVDIFDVYQGKKIEQGKKSVALTITYRAPDRTLDDETVGKTHQKIIQLLEQRFGARLREV